jgi:hypothetical protein
MQYLRRESNPHFRIESPASWPFDHGGMKSTALESDQACRRIRPVRSLARPPSVTDAVPHVGMEPRGVEPRSRGCKPRVLAVDTRAPSKERPPGFEPGPRRWQRRVLPLTPRSQARTEGIEPSSAGLEPASTPRHVRPAPRAGFEPRTLRFRAGDPAVRRPRNELRRPGSNQHRPVNSRASRLDDTASSPPAWIRTTNLPGLSRTPLASWATRG